MTGDDLRRMQNNFLETSKKILLEGSPLRPVGFIVTLHKHLDKLFESGWGIEFIDPKAACLRDRSDDTIATLVVDLAMDDKHLYHVVLNVFPQTRDVLPQRIAVDEAYKQVMRAFLTATKMDEKDITSALMRQICDKVDAFACIYHSEAWMRRLDSSETVDQIYANAPGGLAQDQKSVEVIVSSMETYDFARMITVPIQRAPSPPSSKERDDGKVLGFGEPHETDAVEGRLTGFLKPLPEAS